MEIYDGLEGLPAQVLVFGVAREEAETPTWIPAEELVVLAGGGSVGRRAVEQAIDALEKSGLVERKVLAGRPLFRRTAAGYEAAQHLLVADRVDLFASAETVYASDRWQPERGAPASFAELVGQDAAVRRIEANLVWAERTGSVPVHMLFVGPSGSGKTLLAGLTSRATEAVFLPLSGADLRKCDLDLALEMVADEVGVLFIDELATAPKPVRDALLVALDPRRPARFVAVGATTDPGQLSAPLRRRFPLLVPLGPYSIDAAETIARRRAAALDINLGEGVSYLVARAARSNPAQVAALVLEGAMLVAGTGEVLTAERFLAHLDATGRDARGVDQIELEMLVHLRDGCRNAVGLGKLAQTTGLDRVFIGERLRQLCREGLVLDCGTGGHTISRDGNAYLSQRGM